MALHPIAQRTMIAFSVGFATPSCSPSSAQRPSPRTLSDAKPETKGHDVKAERVGEADKTEEVASEQPKISTSMDGPLDHRELPAPIDVGAPPKSAQTSSSGLSWTVLKSGSGSFVPTMNDKVRVHYTGWTQDGRMFDSSIVRGTPSTFRLLHVIEGWTEALQLMTEGESRRFWIPASLAYGETPERPGAPAGQLTFDIELLEILQAPEVLVPSDVALAPTNATTTGSGLQYVALSKGNGRRPGPHDRVTVHYSGWTQDGRLFDSSVVRERPSTFGVQQVIKGWTEVLLLMGEGGKFRVWVPADLAYGETPQRTGAPSGQLTFDIELIAIERHTDD